MLLSPSSRTQPSARAKMLFVAVVLVVISALALYSGYLHPAQRKPMSRQTFFSRFATAPQNDWQDQLQLTLAPLEFLDTSDASGDDLPVRLTIRMENRSAKPLKVALTISQSELLSSRFWAAGNPFLDMDREITLQPGTSSDISVRSQVHRPDTLDADTKAAYDRDKDQFLVLVKLNGTLHGGTLTARALKQ